MWRAGGPPFTRARGTYMAYMYTCAARPIKRLFLLPAYTYYQHVHNVKPHTS